MILLEERRRYRKPKPKRFQKPPPGKVRVVELVAERRWFARGPAQGKLFNVSRDMKTGKPLLWVGWRTRFMTPEKVRAMRKGPKKLKLIVNGNKVEWSQDLRTLYLYYSPLRHKKGEVLGALPLAALIREFKIDRETLAAAWRDAGGDIWEKEEKAKREGRLRWEEPD